MRETRILKKAGTYRRPLHFWYLLIELLIFMIEKTVSNQYRTKKSDYLSCPRRSSMPVYKDKQQNTWYCKFYYTDWNGVKKQKMKRGFMRQKDARSWERAYFDKLQKSPQMTFSSLTELYLSDMKNRLKHSTMENKRLLARTKLLPYLGDMPIGEIKPTTIRHWQNELIKKGYAATYLKTINNQLSAILNYAVNYYGLRENPCRRAGSIGRKSADAMKFWTKDEFLAFNSFFENDSRTHLAFALLYWTGMRVGELTALTAKDVKDGYIDVNKTYQRLNKKDVVTEPKTPKSKRMIAIPDFLEEELKQYMGRLEKPVQKERLFAFTKYYLYHKMDIGCRESGIKKIRIHDLRHSHASLLIELGCSPVLIAERLGHEDIRTTLNTYAHLYPNKQSEITKKLELLVS